MPILIILAAAGALALTMKGTKAPPVDPRVVELNRIVLGLKSNPNRSKMEQAYQLAVAVGYQETARQLKAKLDERGQ